MLVNAFCMHARMYYAGVISSFELEHAVQG